MYKQCTFDEVSGFRARMVYEPPTIVGEALNMAAKAKQ